jgi:hypothetical protein
MRGALGGLGPRRTLAPAEAPTHRPGLITVQQGASGERPCCCGASWCLRPRVKPSRSCQDNTPHGCRRCSVHILLAAHGFALRHTAHVVPSRESIASKQLSLCVTPCQGAMYAARSVRRSSRICPCARLHMCRLLGARLPSGSGSGRCAAGPRETGVKICPPPKADLPRYRPGEAVWTTNSAFHRP